MREDQQITVWLFHHGDTGTFSPQSSTDKTLACRSALVITVTRMRIREVGGDSFNQEVEVRREEH